MADEHDRTDLDGRRFRALASNTHDAITEIDARGNILYRSPSHAHPTRQEEDPVVLDRIHPEDRKGLAAVFAELFRNAGQVRATFRTLRDDSGIRWIECTGTAFETSEGERRAIVLSRDITESRLMQERLRASRERFQLIAENAYDMIGEIDGEGRVLYANDRVAEVLGTPAGEAHARRELSIFHPDDQPRMRAVVDEALTGGTPDPITFRIAHQVGGWRWLEASCRPVPSADGGPPRVVVIARDISERVESEQRLLESEGRYRGLVESSPLGIIVVQEGVVAFANSSGARICGAQNPSDLVGTPMVDLVVPEQIPRIVERVRLAERGGPGSSFVEVTLCGLDGLLREVIGTGNHIQFHGAPAFQGVVSDATALRRAERESRRLELQLQEARKLESLGLLAGGIAHDFNNLLAVILGNVRFAKRNATLDPELSEALADVVEAGEQAARLTQQLLAYAGRRSPEVRTLDLNELVSSAQGLLRSALPRHATLEIELDPDRTTVRADVVQLEQVLMNLVINAGEALECGRGWVRLRTGTETLQRSAGRFVGGTMPEPGDYAFLEIADNGHGMDPTTRERIFEPFFSTKRQGHGLGLAAVVGLVHGHGGAVEVASNPGEGTRIRVVLPCFEASLPDRPMRDDSSAAVIVCESPVLRTGLETALRDRDLEPLIARDGSEAQELLRLHADEIGLAVCDVSSTGTEPASQTSLVDVLRLERPDLPLLLIGGAGDAPPASLTRDGAVETLPDPCDEVALAAALDVLLGKP